MRHAYETISVFGHTAIQNHSHGIFSFGQNTASMPLSTHNTRNHMTKPVIDIKLVELERIELLSMLRKSIVLPLNDNPIKNYP